MSSARDFTSLLYFAPPPDLDDDDLKTEPDPRVRTLSPGGWSQPHPPQVRFSPRPSIFHILLLCSSHQLHTHLRQDLNPPRVAVTTSAPTHTQHLLRPRPVRLGFSLGGRQCDKDLSSCSSEEEEARRRLKSGGVGSWKSC